MKTLMDKIGQIQNKITSNTLLGMDMHGVRVHTGPKGPAPLRAKAYAQGSEIHLRPDQGNLYLLSHEASHVVQQRQGRVKPT